MMWQSGFPRVMTIDARPCSVTPMKRCGCAAARTASIAICTVPPVPFLNPIGIDMPDASSRWTWLSVVRADRGPAHEVGDVLRRDRIQELAAGGKPERDDV